MLTVWHCVILVLFYTHRKTHLLSMQSILFSYITFHNECLFYIDIYASILKEQVFMYKSNTSFDPHIKWDFFFQKFTLALCNSQKLSGFFINYMYICICIYDQPISVNMKRRYS